MLVQVLGFHFVATGGIARPSLPMLLRLIRMFALLRHRSLLKRILVIYLLGIELFLESFQLVFINKAGSQVFVTVLVLLRHYDGSVIWGTLNLLAVLRRFLIGTYTLAM